MAYILDDIANWIGANQAEKAQQQGIQQAMGVQQNTYNQNAANFQPYVQGGQQSLAQLLQGLQSGAFQANVNPQNLANDPGYQFRMQQAQQALERSAAARGGLNSGAFMKGLDQYSQGLASQEYQDAWNRSFQQGQANFGNLMGMTGMGYGAVGGLAGLGQNYANNMSGLYAAQGNSKAALDMAGANAIGGGIRDAGNLGMMAMGGGFSGLGGLGGLAGLGSGSAPSASSLYASNPGGYSLGSYGLNIPTQGG